MSTWLVPTLADFGSCLYSIVPVLACRLLDARNNDRFPLRMPTLARPSIVIDIVIEIMTVLCDRIHMLVATSLQSNIAS